MTPEQVMARAFHDELEKIAASRWAAEMGKRVGTWRQKRELLAELKRLAKEHRKAHPESSFKALRKD